MAPEAILLWGKAEKSHSKNQYLQHFEQWWLQPSPGAILPSKNNSNNMAVLHHKNLISIKKVTFQIKHLTDNLSKD